MDEQVIRSSAEWERLGITDTPDSIRQRLVALHWGVQPPLPFSDLYGLSSHNLDLTVVPARSFDSVTTFAQLLCTCRTTGATLRCHRC